MAPLSVEDEPSAPASPSVVVPPHAIAVTIVAAPKTMAARVAREWGAGTAAASVAPQNGHVSPRT